MVSRTILLLILLGAYAPAAEVRSISSFQLPDARGNPVEVAANGQVTVVCFLGTECPLAKLYAPRLERISKEFPDIRVFGINSNRQDSEVDWRAYGERHSLTFPLLKDHRNEIADTFQAERTPEVFVLDGDFQIAYRGRIDDQYEPGITRQAPTRNDLQEALRELLAGRPVSLARTTVAGCFIGRVRRPVTASDITYCDQIARVLQRHCVECHRKGEIGPFRLDDYEEAVGWADTMLEVIENGRMPPWHANPAYGEFHNERQMPDADKATLRRWVEAGMPYGDAIRLPQPLEAAQGWSLAQAPDLVLTMSKVEFPVPSDGTVEYQYFVVDPGFDEDRWVTAAQIVPGNPSVVHHSIVFIRPPDGETFRGLGWLTAYVPGWRVVGLPQGNAIRIPAKSKLVFQQHYTPVGSPQSDLTRLGLWLANEAEITHEIYTLVGINHDFEIPPGVQHHRVHAVVPQLPRNATLLAATPHMHVRGKSFRLFAGRGDDPEILLDVPSYDFNWQHTYRFKHPLPLAGVDTLEFDVVFDNSAANPVNPDPDEHVTWGDQTWEEMAIAFFEVSEPRAAPLQTSQTPPVDVHASVPAEQLARRQAEADRMLLAFDKNGDGLIARQETPLAFRRFGFNEIDRNRDEMLTREEIEDAARRRVP